MGMVGKDADWWSCPEKGWGWLAGHRLITNHPFITGEAGLGGIWYGREGAKQPLVRLSWPVNQAGLDYHIWTTLLQPSACSSFASLAHL